MVHRRELDGTTLVLGNQGALWGNAMTWWDHDTGSVWSQPLGEAVAGPRKGKRLQLFPSQLTSWQDWRAAHPHTLALDARGGRSGFDLRTMAIVVDIDGDAAAYLVPTIQRNGVIADTVGGVDLAVVADPRAPDRWNVFARRLGDVVLDLTVSPAGVVDRASGTIWDIDTGVGVTGPLASEPLARIAALTSFPSDFRTFWPHGRVWRER